MDDNGRCNWLSVWWKGAALSVMAWTCTRAVGSVADFMNYCRFYLVGDLCPLDAVLALVGLSGGVD